jgi:hypothetical protein
VAEGVPVFAECEQLGFDACASLHYDDLSKMNSCRLKSAWILAGTAVAAGFMTAQAQQAVPSGGRKIEFSDPRGGLAASNLNAIVSGKAAPPKVENGLKNPFDMFQAGGSLEGVGGLPMQRAPASPVDGRKLKELLEKRQDWQFLEFEDYHSVETIEEAIGITEYGPNGELKEKKSPLERYYERLDRANAPATNRTRNDALFGTGFELRTKNDGSKELNLNGHENEPGAVAEADNPLQQFLRGHPGTPLFQEKSKPGSFADVFGQTEPWKTEALEKSRNQAAHHEEFKRILEQHTLPALSSPSSISGIAPFEPLAPSTATGPTFALPRSPNPTPVAPAAPFSAGRDSLSPLPTAAGLAARPFELPEFSPILPEMTPSTPLPEPTRTVTPPAEFSIPKRRFP